MKTQSKSLVFIFLGTCISVSFGDNPSKRCWDFVVKSLEEPPKEINRVSIGFIPREQWLPVQNNMTVHNNYWHISVWTKFLWTNQQRTFLTLDRCCYCEKIGTYWPFDQCLHQVKFSPLISAWFLRRYPKNKRLFTVYRMGFTVPRGCTAFEDESQPYGNMLFINQKLHILQRMWATKLELTLY